LISLTTRSLGLDSLDSGGRGYMPSFWKGGVML
jgi:hypothetical protein